MMMGYKCVMSEKNPHIDKINAGMIKTDERIRGSVLALFESVSNKLRPVFQRGARAVLWVAP